jgi:hypothetical protein
MPNPAGIVVVTSSVPSFAWITRPPVPSASSRSLTSSSRVPSAAMRALATCTCAGVR